MTIVATASSASANSYVSAAFCDAYAVGTAWASQWEALDDDKKEALIIRACRAIELLPFPGYPSSDTQALWFPATDVMGPRGSYLATDIVPEQIKRVQAHVACYLASLDAGEDPFSIDDTGKLSSLSVGPVSLAFKQGVGADGASFLANVVAPILRPWGLLGSAGSIRLVR